MTWLVFWSAEGPPDVAERLRAGDSGCVPACAQVLEFRRDVIASDPAWTSMRLLPRADDRDAADRYLALVFDQPPPPDQVRDLRYVAARNRLRMAELA